MRTSSPSRQCSCKGGEIDRVERRISLLTRRLRSVLRSKSLSYQEARGLNSGGIYVIYHQKNPVYVGKTRRKAKIRLGEMVHDFRSHTLNRKLLTKTLNRKLGLDRKRIRNQDMQRMIDSGELSRSGFRSLQQKVNKQIRSEFTIRFMESSGKELTDLEHFAIAVLSPEYND